MKTKFIITTLGCKVNQYESEALEQALGEAGAEPAAAQESADICIINTCTITQKASMQSRQAVRRLVRNNPEARIIVTGCYAQISPHKLIQIEGVDSVVGQTLKQQIPSMITSGKLKAAYQKPVILHEDSGEAHHFGPQPREATTKRTRPFLKIQDGCNASCTYCIVPFARGPSRSLQPSSVLEHISLFHKKGFKEVVLTGIHLGAWGRDLHPKTSLRELLQSIEKHCSMQRIRLSSIEPREISDDIIAAIKASNCICPHLHIPLQSGDDEILNKMKRPYDSSYYANLITKIVSALPEVSIGVDVIIGFPGESDFAFGNTYRLIDSLPVAYLHVFPFSSRQGTKAAISQHKLPPEIIKERAALMRALSDQKKKAFYRRFLNQPLRVLVEGRRDRSSRKLKGISANYIPVLFNGDDDLKNREVTIQITSINPDTTVFGIQKKSKKSAPP